MRNVIPLTFILFLTGILHAQDYYRIEVDYATDDQRVLSLYIPENVTEIKGLIVHFHGSYRDDTALAKSDPDLIAFASTYDFAVVSTGFWRISPLGNDSPFSDPSYTPEESIAAFEHGLSQLADESEHPEIINAPWLLQGNSNGGRSTYYINSMRPEKVIAFAQSKLGFYYYDTEGTSVVLDPVTEAARLNPGIIITGELDGVVDNAAIIEGYKLNQALGTNWSWVEIKNEAHNEVDGPSAYFPFFAECVKLRYPEGSSPLNGPISLKDMSYNDGWYISESFQDNGLQEILPVSGNTIDITAYGWTPNEKTAKLFQCLGAQERSDSECTVYWGNSGCANLGNRYPLKDDIINISIDLTDIDWKQVDFYEKDSLVYSAENTSDQNEISFQTDLLSYGENELLAYYAIITRTDDTKEVTRIVNGNLYPKPLWGCFTEAYSGLYKRWFGLFYSENGDKNEGWMVHSEHGRMYAMGENTNNIWFWDKSLQWWWSSENYYPYLWSYTHKTWMYFYTDTDYILYTIPNNTTRYFWNYRLSKWVSYPLN